MIGEDGSQLGVMSSKDVMKIAEEAGLDLVKIAPTAKPPVCRIVDYGKQRKNRGQSRLKKSVCLPISIRMI